jgi:hypothetical protein
VVPLAILAVLFLAASQPLDGRGVPFWEHVARSTDLDTTRGSRLSLMVVDVTGDGRPEIFLAPQPLCGNGGCEWSVYSPAATAGTVRYLGEVLFPEGACLVDSAAPRIRYCSHMSAGTCSLGEYIFGATSVQHRRLGTCVSGEASCERQLTEMRTWLAAHRPAVFDATVAADDTLTGLRWTPRRGDAPQSPPDLDHLLVAAPR